MTNTTWPLLSFHNTFETKVPNFKRWTVPNGQYYKKLHLMKEAGADTVLRGTRFSGRVIKLYPLTLNFSGKKWLVCLS